MRESRTWARGFTLIELMVVVAIIGVLAATAIPAFMKYTKKAKTGEARIFLRKIYDGARQYYMDQAYYDVTTMQPAVRQFPPRPTPNQWFAKAGCCAVGGANEKCEPDAALWDLTPTWQNLHFSIPDPHYYAYTYAAALANAQVFTAMARGDLDCDGQFSEFSMFGTALGGYADGPTGTGKILRVDELE